MCTNPTNGIIVIWSVEHSENMIDFIADRRIYCPSSATEFRLVLDFDVEDEKLSIAISGECEKSIIYDGNISVVSSTGSIKHLDKFNFLSFQHHREQKFNFRLSKEYIYGQNILTLLIQLRNSLKNNITANYSIQTKLKRYICNFEWKLDTQSEKTEFGDESTPCHVFFRKVPSKFSTFSNTNELAILLAFQNFLETNGIYLIGIIDTPEDILIKIKIDAVSENRRILNLIDKDKGIFTDYVKQFDVKKVQELIANKDVFYPQKYLTLNVYMECISYVDMITEVDCLSDTQNVAGLIERSHSQVNKEDSSCKTLSTSMYALYKKKTIL